MLNLTIPGINDSSSIEIDNTLVIIGSNGSGKSRLGSFFENNIVAGPVKRISAQRMLNLPENTPILSVPQSYQNWRNSWSNRHVIEVQNDYETVLSTLFAKTRKRNDDYVEDSKSNNSGVQLEIPLSDSEKLIKIWDRVFPNIRLDLTEGKVLVIDKNGIKYSGREMSDGERVAFYLIAQCLIIPDDYVIIIDEPELHLHKSLMNRLWNQIENARTDCKFIYITHDLDFASGRTNSKKIWIKSYFDNKWEWDEVPNLDFIPENLLLEIIGSRKPILFIEGEKNSIDYKIYQHIYTNFTIIPRGGCQDVIQSTKGINNNKELHLNKAYGLIDRDFKSDGEICALESENIYVLKIAEIENLMASPLIIKMVADHLNLNYSEIENKIINFVVGLLSINFDKEVSYRTSLDVSYRLNTLNHKASGIDNIKKAVEELTNSIDIDLIYAQNHELYSDLIQSRDIQKILNHYTNKGIAPEISKFFEQSPKGYINLVISLLKNKPQEFHNQLGVALSQKLFDLNISI